MQIFKRDGVVDVIIVFHHNLLAPLKSFNNWWASLVVVIRPWKLGHLGLPVSFGCFCCFFLCWGCETLIEVSLKLWSEAHASYVIAWFSSADVKILTNTMCLHHLSLPKHRIALLVYILTWDNWESSNDVTGVILTTIWMRQVFNKSSTHKTTTKTANFHS